MAGETTFLVQQEDYIAACRAYNLQEIRSWRFVRKILLGAGVAGVLVTFVTALSGNVTDAIYLAPISIIAGLCVVPICIGLGFLLLPRRAAKLFRQQRALHHEIRFQWTSSGSTWRTAQGNNEILWLHYHRWASTPKAFLLYINDSLYHFIPKRALSDAQSGDLQETIEISGLVQR